MFNDGKVQIVTIARMIGVIFFALFEEVGPNMERIAEELPILEILFLQLECRRYKRRTMQRHACFATLTNSRIMRTSPSE